MSQYTRYPVISGGGGGSGTVTSVGLSDGSTTPIFSIGGSPVTTSGTLTLTLTVETANKVFAGPTTGSAAQPTFRSLVVADLPASALINPMTTTGDMIYSSSGSTPARRAIGSTGNLLQVVAGVPTWTAPAATTQVLYNQSGLITGKSNMTFNQTSNTLSVDNALVPVILTTPSIYSDVGPSVDVFNNYLIDQTNVKAVDWTTRIMYDGGTGISVNWGAHQLQDISNTISMDYANRSMLSPDGTDVLNWNNLVLSEGSGGASINWGARALVQSNGFDWAVDWNNYLLYDGLANASMNWQERTMYDNSQGIALNYGDEGGILIARAVRSYNNDVTVGNGLASIVATASETIQADSIGPTTLFSPASDGMYQASVYYNIASSGADGTIVTSIGWQDAFNTRSKDVGTPLPMTVDGSEQGVITFFAVAGSSITYSTSVVDSSDNPSYNVYVTITRLS